ncbi:MAG: hypothetical protein AABW58_04555 [Nanoarchaeota archaeon]
MELKRVIFLILLSLLLVSPAFAQKIDISSIKVDSKAFPGSDIIFQLKVKNLQIREDIIKVTPDPFSIQPFSDVASGISVSPSQLTIPANSEGLYEVKVKYSQNIKPEKAYTVNLIVQSLLNSDVKQVYPLTSFILSSGEIISLKPKIPEKTLPSREFLLNIVFKNNLNQDFVDLDFLITSSHFNEEHKVTLTRNQELVKAFPINLPSETPAGNYDIFLRLYQQGSLKGEEKLTLKVEESQDIQEKINRDSGFLSTRTTITKINNGNIKIDKTVKYPLGSFQKIFTETSIRADFIKENSETFLQWSLSLNPGQEQNIVIETNYNSLFFTILGLIILFGIIFYTRTRALRIIKRVMLVKEGKDKKHLKVVLTIQNYTNKDINDLKIIDLLPKLIKHYSDFGTLEPKHIQQGSHSLRFIWEIHKLHRGEERIISYKIEPQLNLYGNIRLPSASLQLTKDNKLIIRKSNIAKFELKKEL